MNPLTHISLASTLSAYTADSDQTAQNAASEQFNTVYQECDFLQFDNYYPITRKLERIYPIDKDRKFHSTKRG